MSSLLNGREMLTESIYQFVVPKGRERRHTDRDEKVLGSPDLCKSLDDLRLGTDIPAELFLSSTISMEETAPVLLAQA
jgi:hypothetical protein